MDSSIIGSYTELGINTHMPVESLLYSLSNITELFGYHYLCKVSES